MHHRASAVCGGLGARFPDADDRDRAEGERPKGRVRNESSHRFDSLSILLQYSFDILLDTLSDSVSTKINQTRALTVHQSTFSFINSFLSSLFFQSTGQPSILLLYRERISNGEILY